MWELWLPLLVCLATIIVMALLFFAARRFIFRPRAEDHPEEVSKSGPH